MEGAFVHYRGFLAAAAADLLWEMNESFLNDLYRVRLLCEC
jgi:hypothetical protein